MIDFILLFIVAMILGLTLYGFTNFITSAKPSMSSILLGLIGLIPVSIIAGIFIFLQEKTQNRLENTKEAVRKNEEIICYKNILKTNGILIRNAKMLKENEVLSEKKEVFKLINCYPLTQEKENGRNDAKSFVSKRN